MTIVLENCASGVEMCISLKYYKFIVWEQGQKEKRGLFKNKSYLEVTTNSMKMSWDFLLEKLTTCD